MGRIRQRLRNEDGSIVGAAAFVMFAGLACATVAGLVISGTGTQSQADGMAAAGNAMTTQQQVDMSKMLAGTHENYDPDQKITTFQLKTELDGQTLEQASTVREFQAAYIAGYDDAGNPVWVDRLGALDHRFGQIVSAGNYTCGLEPTGDDAGSIWCWGANHHHQLGNGSDQDASEPTQVTSSIKFDRLHQGTDDAICASARTTNLLNCWGFNEHGQLGKTNAGQDIISPTVVVDTANRKAPAVKDDDGAVALSSNTLVFIGVDGTLYALGANAGVTGAGSTTITTPVPGVKFSQVAADANTVSALTESGDIYAWSLNGLGAPGVPGTGGVTGDGPTFEPAFATDGGALEITRAAVSVPAGQLSDQGGQHTPVKVPHPAAGKWASLSIAPNDTGITRSTVYAVDTSGSAYAWGSDSNGQLGNPAKIDSDTPTRIEGLSGIKQVSAGGSTAVALGTNGLVYTWGVGTQGQLGNGTTTARQDIPVAVKGIAGATNVYVATGDKGLICATLDGTQSTCWGANDFGQTGASAGSPVTIPVTKLPLGMLSIGDDFACGLDEFNKATCWGRGELGETGRGHTADGVGTSTSQAPAQIAKRDDTVRRFTGFFNGGTK